MVAHLIVINPEAPPNSDTLLPSVGLGGSDTPAQRDLGIF